MPAKSPSERLARLESILLSSDRYVDALLEVHTHEGEVVVRTGGCWDRHRRKYVDRPCKVRVVVLQESQLELGRAFGRWLEKCRRGEPRPYVLMGGGNRGSGKTYFLGGIATVVIALEFPGCWQYAINITAKQKRECLEAIRAVGAHDWIQEDINDFRDPRTRFLTRSTISWLSAQNPRAIRSAGLPIRYVLVNEGQDMPQSVGINAVAAIRNTGGVVGVATNPPQTERSDWVASWWTGIEAGELNGEKYFLDNKLNRTIDQDALPDIAAFLYAIDREAGEADAAGVFKLSGPTAYPGFKPLPIERGGHIGAPPSSVVGIGDGLVIAGWTDVTAEETGKAIESGVGFPFVCGVDWQRLPGIIGEIAKLYRNEKGELVLVVLDQIAVRGVEPDFSQALVASGYVPAHGMDGSPVLLIGDATGARQNSEHKFSQPTSFVAMRADGWKVIPPMRHWKHGTPWNPLVRDSRAQMHGLFEQYRILIAPKCKEPCEGFPSLVESFRRAKVGPKGGLIEKGNFQHGPDGVRYLAWRFMPRPKPGPVRSDPSLVALFQGIRITQT